MKILFVEDEVNISNALKSLLEKSNYKVDCVYDGEDGYYSAIYGIYDLLILDVMLPKINGFELIRKLRKEGIKTPTIMLTARGELSDKINGLDYGADDYITKPFEYLELAARIKALIRRKIDIFEDNAIRYKDLILDPQTYKLICNEKEVKLTLKEYEMLEFLIIQTPIITSKELMIEKLWGFDSEAEHNHVEVYISFLRKKLQFLKSEVFISTVRSIGYVLESKYV
jgi:DNA-binding response OmpR family regulator